MRQCGAISFIITGELQRDHIGITSDFKFKEFNMTDTTIKGVWGDLSYYIKGEITESNHTTVGSFRDLTHAVGRYWILLLYLLNHIFDAT
jgi:hypothetical protein